MYVRLENISEDDLGVYDENGCIDFFKWNIYFDLAVEIKAKVLIPQDITIEEFISLL